MLVPSIFCISTHSEYPSKSVNALNIWSKQGYFYVSIEFVGMYILYIYIHVYIYILYMYISIINPTVDRGAQEFNPSSNPQAIG